MSTSVPPNRTQLKIILTALISWAIPYDYVERLRRNKDPIKWINFRDGLMSRWSILNVVTGLILGAVSTVVCSNIQLSALAFALGIVSLLTSLISIGFGTGLMYVLGDATAETLQKVAEGYPALFPYALAIPQLWAAGSFAIFFVEILVITWNKQHAGWTVKAGIILAITITVVHLTGFLVLHASNPIDSDSALEPEMIHIQEGGDHDTSSAADPQSRPPDRAQRGGN